VLRREFAFDSMTAWNCFTINVCMRGGTHSRTFSMIVTVEFGFNSMKSLHEIITYMRRMNLIGMRPGL
jgi:hypothetical protein